MKRLFSSLIHKSIIIGSGPAGYTAGIYLGRAMLSPLILAGSLPGGQLMLTSDIENFPGYESISGIQLMENMREQAKKNGANILDIDVSKVIKKTNETFEIITSSGNIYQSLSVIVATGAQSLWLNAKNEEIYKGKGISTCATCDGFFFRNQEVIVIGGGDSAFEEALYLSNICSKITIVHRRDKFRASKILYNRVLNSSKIQLLTNHIVDEWTSANNSNSLLGGAILKNTVTGEKLNLSFQGAFIAIGHKPSTQFLDNLLPLDEDGYILVKPGSSYTDVSGVFACGDVVDKRYRQAITAAGVGCMAAIDCERWLSHHE